MKIIIQITALLFSVIFLWGCKNKNAEASNPTIFTGKNIEVTEQIISSEGGIIKINKPGDPLNGLIINVPNASYNNARKFNISYAEIKNHKLGPDFNPISPLITISNGGGYSDSVMTINIPVNVPEGEFAMAFLYDDRTGKLEGMPLLISDGKRVVVATRNFVHSSVSNISNNTAGQINATQADVDKIVISAVKEENLRGDYNTGFVPGVDDCPFTNYGSTYTPRGQCNGQSVTMMWYYCNKKLNGGSSLYTLLDNDGVRTTPKFWKDDALGIKLACVLQKDFSYNPITILRAIFGGTQIAFQSAVPDKITRNAFRYSIKLTHEPQLLHMIGSGTGHAVVLYKIVGNAFYVADPNYPGDRNRIIIYDDVQESFLPYLSGENARLLGVPFSSIYYYAKSSMFGWPTAASHWAEFENKTIGNGIFPDFTIVALNDREEFVPLTDGFIVPGQGKLTVLVRCPGRKTYLTVYNTNYKTLIPDDGAIQLPGGDQEIGVSVMDENGNWMGFKWIKVKVDNNNNGTDNGSGGPAIADLLVNGTQLHITDCWFSSINNYFSLGGPTVHPGTESYFSLRIDENFHGVGEYTKFSGDWQTWDIQPAGTFHKGDEPGLLKITKLSEDKVEGSFSFICSMPDVSGNEPKMIKVKVEGQFH